MPTLTVTEFKSAVSGIGSYLAQVPAQPPLAIQSLAISGTTNPSAAFNAATYAVELISDTACHVLFGDGNGSTPVALSTSQYIPANVPLRYAVAPGQKVAVIT